MTKWRPLLRSVGIRAAQLFGSPLRDARTGQELGRVLLIPWRGKIHVIGLEEVRVRPVFVPQERLTYWKQEIGFTTHDTPDFPREAQRKPRKRMKVIERSGTAQEAGRLPAQG